MLKRLSLAAFLGLATPALAAVDTPDSPTVSFASENTSIPISYSHTVTAGTTLLIVDITMAANREINSVTWNGDSLTLIQDLDGSTDSADIAQEVWGLLSPTAATGNVVITGDGANFFNAYISTAINFSGTTTSSLGTTVSVVDTTLNNTTTSSSCALDSGGTSGNALVAYGAGIGDDMTPASNASSFNELHDAGSGGGALNSLDHSSYVAELLDNAPSGITISWGADDENVCGLFEIEAASSSGEYDTTPSVTGQNTTDYTIGGSLDAAGDVDAVACLKDQTAPTISQVQAGNCTGDVAAEATDSASPSTGDFDFSLTLTPADSFPKYDIYVTDGTTLTTLADEQLDPPSTCGENSDELCQFVDITSIGAGSPCEDFNTEADPDIASPDILTAPANVSPGGGEDESLTIGADCQMSFDSDNTGRQSALNISIYDVSAEGTHASDLDVWFNNSTPVCGEADVLVFTVDEAITNIDLDDFCSDADAEQLTYSVTSGTLPTGISLAGATGVLSGTPTVEDESGAAITFTATDEASATDTLERTMYPIDTVTLSDYTAGDEDAAESQHGVDFPWQDDETFSLVSTYTCSESEAANEVISQDPVATTEVTAFQAVTITVSLGETTPGCVSRGKPGKAVIRGVSM